MPINKVAIVGTTAKSLLHFRAGLIRVLVARGIRVEVLAMDWCPLTRYEADLLGAVPVCWGSGKRSGLNLFSEFYAWAGLVWFFRQSRPDAVLCFFLKPIVMTAWAAFVAGVPRCVGLLEGLGYFFTQRPRPAGYKVRIIRRFLLLLLRWSLPRLSHLVVLNQDDAAELQSRWHLRLPQVTRLGGIGVDLKHFMQMPVVTQPFCAIFVARLLAEKGVQEWVAAARKVKQIHPDVRFLMLGELDALNPGGLTQQQLDCLLTDKVVDYLGFKADVRPWLAECSVFVLPSYREGLPMSTQEAMAVGRAVITTDVPGCRDTVVDQVNGFVVPPFNSEALAERLLELINNPCLVVTMGEASRRFAELHFDADQQCLRLAQLVSGDESFI